MKKRNIINFSLFFSVIPVTLSLSTTFAKFTFEKTGTIWTIDFTKLSLTDKLYIIEDPNGFQSGNYFGNEGAIRIPSETEYNNLSDERKQELIDEIKKYDSSFGNEFASYQDFCDAVNKTYSNESNSSGSLSVSGGSSNYDGYYYFPQSKFDTITKDYSSSSFVQSVEEGGSPYAIGNVKDVIFNVSNSTDIPMLVSFDIYYYAQKSDSESKSFTCGIYNNTLHGDNLLYTDVNVMKGEFLSLYTRNLIFREYTYYYFFKDKIANVNSMRTGGDLNVDDDGTEYYPYKATMNPYYIKKDPDLKTYYESINTASNPRYSGFGSTTNDLDYNLSDFILPAHSSLYSFNVALFCGTQYGVNNSSSAGYAFVAGIEMKVEPISKYPDINDYL